jgi:branched-chain amino acid transport system ATP-binding protein
VSAMLEVQGLHAYYGESHVLQGVDLAIESGHAVSLVGRNGAGKTTTLAAIAGFLRPRRGAVRIDGADLTGAPAHRVARAGVALVPQGRRIFSDLTIHENLMVAARAVPGGWSEEKVIDLLPALGQRFRLMADQLSGGEQQMLAIGRALMRNPLLLLLDEPSEGLAPKLVDEVGAALVRLREGGLTLFLVEQNLTLASAVGERMFVMNKGTIVFSGAVAELAAAREIEARYLGV